MAANLVCSLRQLPTRQGPPLPSTNLLGQGAILPRLPAFRSTSRNVSLIARASISGSQISRILLEDKAGKINVRPQVLAFSGTILWDIVGGLWRLPKTLADLISGKETVIEEVEKKVDKAAELVKKTAETIANTAQEVGKVAEVVSEDADKVEAMMDKVEKTTKTVADDLTEASDDLKGAADTLKGAADTLKDTATKASSPSSSSTSPSAFTADNNSKFISIGHLQLRFVSAAAVAMVWLLQDVRSASNDQLRRQIGMVLQAA